jgi:outer membrane protein OmpA-like peptidoglycan-associated protein
VSRYIVYAAGLIILLIPVFMVSSWVSGAEARLAEAEAVASEKPSNIAVASQANESYCTPALKKILRRVLQSCGLVGGRAGRGCQPMDAKNVATMSGDDFNALFVPMVGRGGIVQFEQAKSELDLTDSALIDKVFADRKGASYFFVVSRASPEGSVTSNRELSRSRAESVLTHLQTTFHDPDLDKQVGLLWLGEEFAQLDPSFCNWPRSSGDPTCTPESLNRSAFVTWVDCQL